MPLRETTRITGTAELPKSLGARPLRGSWVLASAAKVDFCCTVNSDCVADAVYVIVDGSDVDGSGACADHADAAGVFDLRAEFYKMAEEAGPLPSSMLAASGLKPERCSCSESIALRDELAMAASLIAGLLAHDGETPKTEERARRWLETYDGRLP